MAKLVPFNKKMQKKMGYVNTKQGPMVDSSKLQDKPKFTKKVEVVKVKKESPVKKQQKEEAEKENKRLEERGVYSR